LGAGEDDGAAAQRRVEVLGGVAQDDRSAGPALREVGRLI
jgi:hypothetical protein